MIRSSSFQLKTGGDWIGKGFKLAILANMNLLHRNSPGGRRRWTIGLLTTQHQVQPFLLLAKSTGRCLCVVKWKILGRSGTFKGAIRLFADKPRKYIRNSDYPVLRANFKSPISRTQWKHTRCLWNRNCDFELSFGEDNNTIFTALVIKHLDAVPCF
jgi:hypothetical protein